MWKVPWNPQVSRTTPQSPHRKDELRRVGLEAGEVASLSSAGDELGETAAPSRGDRLLGSQLAAEAAACVLAPEDTERRRRRREKRKALARKPSGAARYGCGALLQTAEEAAPGYVDPSIYELVINARWSDTRR
ncbi:hypothetical protein E2562_031488 [Oryza meyeriana var. granulata]|uniref:Uncharacterized protein n=1 Tax=Oryza meyeriana var. granulata TaxID=110450 RepID=A0A6G1ERM9_9ORYZ|nr:hypothetical protein E2562_031488 [Oryza meyeriana var. granulata]